MTRARRLARRAVVDRGLPPEVWRLYRAALATRIRRPVDRAVAALLPARGRRDDRRQLAIVRVGARRWATAGPVDCSAFELAHLHARAVVDALEEAGLRPFTVARDDGMVLGLEVAEQGRAWHALQGLRRAPGWYVEPVRNEWRVWSARSLGADHALGRAERTVLTFWEPMGNGRLERIGVRGQERFARSSPWTTEVVDGREYPGRAALPVGDELDAVTFPVDLVYTWVDGADPAWRNSFEEWLRREGRAESDAAVHASRYHSRDELLFSMRSAWLYAGWARRIFVVTNGQRPAWLADHPRVTVVAHAELFPDSWLPTFNSHAIESRLHHVPGLAEHFVYLNDDVFLGRPTTAATFFTPNGLARVFPSSARVTNQAADGCELPAVDTAAVRGRDLLRQRFGRRVGFKLHHAPFALRRSVLDDLAAAFPEEFARTGQSRFRRDDDLSIAASLANHYALLTERAVLSSLAVVYAHLESGRLSLHLGRLEGHRAFDAFCLNATEGQARDAPSAARLVEAFLGRYFPVAAPWETRRPGVSRTPAA